MALPPNFQDSVQRLAQTVNELSNRVQDLEDAQAMRNLHHAYCYYIDKCLYPAVVDLFLDLPDASVHFLNGIWQGKVGAKRLYVDWFGVLFTKGTNKPPHGFCWII